MYKEHTWEGGVELEPHSAMVYANTAKGTRELISSHQDWSSILIAHG